MLTKATLPRLGRPGSLAATRATVHTNILLVSGNDSLYRSLDKTLDPIMRQLKDFRVVR
ncbi:MAG: hypothetical protein WBL63_17975 [Candidatus Acidiferrum sp.]